MLEAVCDISPGHVELRHAEQYIHGQSNTFMGHVWPTQPAVVGSAGVPLAPTALLACMCDIVLHRLGVHVLTTVACSVETL